MAQACGSVAMKAGIHFMNFTLPGGAASLRAAVGDTAVAESLAENVIPASARSAD
jgi:hypothetical protein